MKPKISKGFRKYLRKEKARIRREIIDVREQEKLIEELYENIPRFSAEKSK